MTFLWVCLGLIGAVVLFLVFNDDGGAGRAFGLPNSQFAEVALMSMWGAIIAAAVIPRQGNLKTAARNALAWILILLVLVAGYVYRYDLQSFASRITGGLVPGSPVTAQTDDGRNQVILTRSADGHFTANTLLNEISVRMLVDTGATNIVLSDFDARAIGIDAESLSFNVPVFTANGQAWAAKVQIDNLELGTIKRRNIPALVSAPGALNESLLGMTLLNSLTAFEFRGDQLYLTE